MRSLAIAFVCALGNPFAADPPPVELPPTASPTHLLEVALEDLRGIPDTDEIRAAGPAELEELHAGLAPLRAQLERSARTIAELTGRRRPPVIPQAGMNVCTLARAFRAEAVLAAQRRDPDRAVRAAVTVLQLAQLLAAQPVEDAPDAWLARQCLVRNTILAALRDPRTIAGAAPAELERLRALLESGPPPDWERAVRAMPAALARMMSEVLERNPGMSLRGDAWYERLVIPRDTAERALWVAVARERLDACAARMLALVTPDHDATTRALQRLRFESLAPRSGLSYVLDCAWRQASARARAEENAGLAVEHLTMLITMRNAIALGDEGRRIALGHAERELAHVSR